MTHSANALFSRWRRDLGLTTRELAARIGCSGPYVTQIEHSLRRPGRDLAVRIEAESAGWEHGPIRVTSWSALARPPQAPTPSGRKGIVFARDRHVQARVAAR